MHYYYFSKYCIGFLLCLCAAEDMCMFNVLLQDLNGGMCYVYLFMCGCVCTVCLAQQLPENHCSNEWVNLQAVSSSSPHSSFNPVTSSIIPSEGWWWLMAATGRSFKWNQDESLCVRFVAGWILSCCVCVCAVSRSTVAPLAAIEPLCFKSRLPSRSNNSPDRLLHAYCQFSHYS